MAASISCQFLSERRAWCRYPLDIELAYAARGDGPRSFSGVGRAKNISNGGVLFESDKALSPGTFVELTILWRAGNSLVMHFRIGGRIVRAEGRQIAVCILPQDGFPES